MLSLGTHESSKREELKELRTEAPCRDKLINPLTWFTGSACFFFFFRQLSFSSVEGTLLAFVVSCYPWSHLGKLLALLPDGLNLCRCCSSDKKAIRISVTTDGLVPVVAQTLWVCPSLEASHHWQPTGVLLHSPLHTPAFRTWLWLAEARL